MPRKTAIIHTRHGTVDLLDPRPCDLDIYDIAVALSREGRYANQTRQFCSVAQHSVEVMKLAQENGYNSQDCLRACLVHDATEAYLRDIPRPLKAHLPEYQAIEDRFMLAVAERFDVDFERWRGVIYVYDRLACIMEMDLLIADRVIDWAFKYPHFYEKGFLKPQEAFHLFWSAWEQVSRER